MEDAGNLPAVVRSVEQIGVVLLVADGAGHAYQVLLRDGHRSVAPQEDVEKLGLLDVLVDFRVVVPSVAAGSTRRRFRRGTPRGTAPCAKARSAALGDCACRARRRCRRSDLRPRRSPAGSTPRRSAGLHLVSAGGQGVRRQRRGPDATDTELVRHLLQSSYFPSKTERLCTTELKHEGQLNSVNCVGGGLQTAPYLPIRTIRLVLVPFVRLSTPQQFAVLVNI